MIFAHFAKEKKFSQFCRKPNASRLEGGNDTNYLEFSEDKSNTHLHSVHWPCSPNVNVCFWQLLQETVKTFTTNSDTFQSKQKWWLSQETVTTFTTNSVILHKNSDNFHKRQYNNFHKEQWHSNTMNLWWPQGRSRAGLTFFSFDNLTPYFLLSDFWWQTTNSFLLALNTHNWPPSH